MKDIFYKQRYKELKRLFDENKEVFNEYFETTKSTTERNENWIWDLLNEKSNLEAKVHILKNKNDKLEEEKKSCTQEIEELKKSNNDLLISTSELKVLYKKTYSSSGGLQKKNAQLLKEIGEKDMYIKLLLKQFKKRNIKAPTLKELQEYEITHKSPYTKIKESEE